MVEDPTKETSETNANELPNVEAQEAKKAEAAEEKVGGEEASSEKEKSITQAEHMAALEAERKRYSGLDSKLSKITEENKRLAAAMEEANQKILDAQDAAYLRKVEEDGGDVDVAKETLKRIADQRKKDADLQRRERELTEREAFVNEAGKGLKATNLVKEYELDPKVVDDLLACETPEKMENTALKLHVAKLRATAKPATKVDNPEEGRKIDVSHMSLEERAQLAMDGKL